MNGVVLILALVGWVSCQTCTYENDFFTGQLGSDTPQCTQWNEFRECAGESAFAEVRVTSSLSTDMVYECTDPEPATEICNYLSLDPVTTPATLINCQGRQWRVGICSGGMELALEDYCACSGDASVRPCSGDWGGANQTTCDAPAQSLRVECVELAEVPAPSPLPTATPAVCTNVDDGNLNIEYPPLLDETRTRVVFDDQGIADFEIRILVPRQYDVSTRFWFEGADDTSGGYDSSETGEDSNVYWTPDAATDPCNIVYNASIPWNTFRSSLGNVREDDFTSVRVYSTEIVFQAQQTLTLTPETLLEIQGKDLLSLGLTQAGPITYIRTVTSRIPFTITFQTELTLADSELVVVPIVLDDPGSNLRIQAALLESSVVEVDPDGIPGYGSSIAKANLGLVTIIPLPLTLVEANVVVDDPALSFDLSISENVTNSVCDPTSSTCTQFWDIAIFPRACTITGEYNVTVRAGCHPSLLNCVPPESDTRIITLSVVSDDFCGISQRVTVQGELSLDRVDCNDNLVGTVNVRSADSGAAIVDVQVVEVIASPTLAGATSMVVYNASSDIDILNFTETLVAPSTNQFTFKWLGAQLRCDVEGTVEVKVRVEYDATASQALLLEDSVSDKHLALQQVDEDTLRLVTQVSITPPVISNGELPNPPMSGAFRACAMSYGTILFTIVATAITLESSLI